MIANEFLLCHSTTVTTYRRNHMLQFDDEKTRPPKIIIYGVEGVGKTHFGALAEKPVFLKAEDGLIANKYSDVKSWKVNSYADVQRYLNMLASEQHDRKTLVVDSLDRIEHLIHDQVCKERNVQAIASIDYGKGYEFAIDIWREYLSMLDYLNTEIGMTIIQIAHAKIAKYANPETESYDRYSVRLHESASGKTSAARLLIEDSDMVLFASYLVGVTQTKDGDRQRAVGSSEQRVIHTQERPVAVAKNRFDLPAQIPFDKEGKYWEIIRNHVPYFNKGE